VSNQLSLTPSYYEALKRLTLELAGVELGADHTFLVETRLSALARKEGFDTLSQMIEELFSRGQTRLAVQVVSSLLQRASRFFDDRKGYETLGDILLPKLHKLYSGSTLRILSYGCSSGQEVYSTAILADKFSHALPNMPIEITGVDFPSWALERAKTGRFTHFEVQRGLPIRHLIEYFDRDGEDWVVKNKLQERIHFEDHNLLSNPSSLGKFQIVMFRGNMKHYSDPAAARIMNYLSGMISADGYLLLGSNEKFEKRSYGFKISPIAPGCYQKEAQSKVGAPPKIAGGTEPDTPTAELSLPQAIRRGHNAA